MNDSQVDTDCASESASSIFDDEKVRRLFQACDTNGDGYIDSHDLLAVCQSLGLEDSLDELMLQLGADSQGRISYENFVQRRLALKPEIEAIKSANLQSPLTRDVSSENSLGKLDSWEWDSGARDLSPITRPGMPIKKYSGSPFASMERVYKERLQQQLAAQSQRYEEELTELHSVIAELTRKLQQQRAMAIVEEDEQSVDTSPHEGSVTCPLDISEITTENDHTYVDDTFFDTEPKDSSPDSPSTLPEPKLFDPEPTHALEHLQNEIGTLCITDKHEVTSPKISNLDNMFIVDDDAAIARNVTPTINIVPVHSAPVHSQSFYNPSVQLKFETFKSDYATQQTAAKQKAKPLKLLKSKSTNNSPCITRARDLQTRAGRDSDENDPMAKIVSNMTDDYQRIAIHIFEAEINRLTCKLENCKAQNNVLHMTLSEVKSNCDRLTLLCGKYESNAVALKVALGLSDRAIEIYDMLLALLETELSLDHAKPASIENRRATEQVALQLLSRLDKNETDALLSSPWENDIVLGQTSSDEAWSHEHEIRLRDHVSNLKAQRNVVEGTVVVFEPLNTAALLSPDALSMKNSADSDSAISLQEVRKYDLETAVLMQELMSLREDKAQLTARVYHLEKEKICSEMKMSFLENQQVAQQTALNNLRAQLVETETTLANHQKDHSSLSDSDHTENMEIELSQALAREARLKSRLQELVSTLETVTKTAETRLLEGKELVADLSTKNSALVQTVDTNNKIYKARLRQLEERLTSKCDQKKIRDDCRSDDLLDNISNSSRHSNNS